MIFTIIWISHKYCYTLVLILLQPIEVTKICHTDIPRSNHILSVSLSCTPWPMIIYTSTSIVPFVFVVKWKFTLFIRNRFSISYQVIYKSKSEFDVNHCYKVFIQKRVSAQTFCMQSVLSFNTEKKCLSNRWATYVFDNACRRILLHTGRHLETYRYLHSDMHQHILDDTSSYSNQLMMLHTAIYLWYI